MRITRRRKVIAAVTAGALLVLAPAAIWFLENGPTQGRRAASTTSNSPRGTSSTSGAERSTTSHAPASTTGDVSITSQSTPSPSTSSPSTSTKTSTTRPSPGSGSSGSATMLGGCSIFPSDNPWNRDITGDPIDSNSAAYIASINSGASELHPDFGSNPDYGIPFVVVPSDQPMVPIAFTAYGDESDPGPYPVPANAPIEAGGDRHVLVLQQGACQLYELYAAVFNGTSWSGDSGAIFDLNSNALRPDGWTSADAAGLPILPGLVRYDEVRSGVITHALRFTVSETQRGYIHPATHFASSSDAPALPPMGLRLRLRADFDLSSFSGDSLVILTALKRFGMIVADNGSDWFISGATDSRWNDENLEQLKGVPGSAFEVVQSGPILTN